MPTRTKKQTAGKFVEVSLKIAKERFPLVSEALTAVMALAGNPVSLGPKPQAAKTAKAAPAATRKRRRTGKKPVSPETAALVRELRVKAGLSQKAVADKSGVSQNQISLLETGKQRLNPALAKKLGRLFKTPLEPQTT
jgi:DNA-binding XRE family transcriptional regulator